MTAGPARIARLRGAGFDRLFPAAYVLLYALVALGVHFAWFPVGDLAVESDYYGELATAAQKLAHGQFSVANYPFKGPLTSFALVAVHPLCGDDWYLTGVLLNALCAAVGLWLVYGLIRRLYGRTVAVGATMAVSLTFEFFLHAHKGSSDLLFFALVTGAVALLVTERWAPRRLLGAGALGGLAMLTRYNGLIVPAAGVAVLLLVDPARLPWPRRARAAALVAGAFAATVAPWYLASLLQSGRPLATHNLQAIFVEEVLGAGTASDDAWQGPRSLPALVASAPGRVAATWLANIPKHFGLDLRTLLWPLGALLAALGLLRLALVRPTRAQTALLAFALAYFLAMCPVYYQPRFFLPLLPAYFALAWSVVAGAAGETPRFAAPWTRLVTRPPAGLARGTFVVAVVLAAMTTLQLRTLVKAERYYYQQRPLFVLTAAPAVRDVAARAGVRTILARKPHLPFYAGLGYRLYPPSPGSRAELIANALAQGADGIVVTPLERMYFPGLGYLDHLDGAAGAKLLLRDRDVTFYQLDRSLTPAEAGASRLLRELSPRRQQAWAAGDTATTIALTHRVATEQMAGWEWRAGAGSLLSAIELAARHESALPPGELNALHLDLAQCLLALKKYDEGLSALTPFAADFAADTDARRRGNFFVLVARLERGRGHAPAAAAALRQARDVFTQAGLPEAAAEVAREEAVR